MTPFNCSQVKVDVKKDIIHSHHMQCHTKAMKPYNQNIQQTQIEAARKYRVNMLKQLIPGFDFILQANLRLTCERMQSSD